LIKYHKIKPNKGHQYNKRLLQLLQLLRNNKKKGNKELNRLREELIRWGIGLIEIDEFKYLLYFINLLHFYKYSRQLLLLFKNLQFVIKNKNKYIKLNFP
jgi:hypothetical protein